MSAGRRRGGAPALPLGRHDRPHPVAVGALPHDATVAGGRDRLWVTVTATDRVDAFDLHGTTPRRIRAFPTARQPNTVAVDTTDGRGFVAGAASGTVQIFDPADAHSLR